MVESDPNQDEPNPGQVLDEEKDEEVKKDFKEQAVRAPPIIITPYARNPLADADEEKGGILASLATIAYHASNLPTISILFLGMLATNDDDLIRLERGEREERKRLLASLASIARSDKQTIIVKYFYKHGAATQTELYYKFTLDWSMISRTIKKLVACGIIKKVGYVNEPYRPPGRSGNPPSIYALVGVDPKAAEEAQIRYAETIEKLEPEIKHETFKSEMQQLEDQRDAQREAHVLKVKTLYDQVLVALPRPLTMQSTPIYNVLNDLDVGPRDPIRKEVTETVLRSIQTILRRIQEAEA